MCQVEKHVIAFVNFVISGNLEKNNLKAKEFTPAVVAEIPSGLPAPFIEG